jgi:hypothetical protein
VGLEAVDGSRGTSLFKAVFTITDTFIFEGVQFHIRPTSQVAEACSLVLVIQLASSDLSASMQR